MYKENVMTEGVLPSIAIRGIAPFPHTDLRIEVGRNISKKALLEAEKNYASHVLLLIQENPIHDEVNSSHVLNHGVVARIGIKIKLPNGNYKVKFDPIVRAEILQFQQTEPFFITRFKTLPLCKKILIKNLLLYACSQSK